LLNGEKLATLVEHTVLLHNYEIPQADELPRIHRPRFEQPQHVDSEYILGRRWLTATLQYQQDQKWQ
jgi:hypothetical protein